MTLTKTAPHDIAALRAAYRAKVAAEFDPKVPGLPGDGAPVVLHTDHHRGLTYTWFDRSTHRADASPRESGMETSLLAVTHGEHQVAHLRVSFTTTALLNHLFASPFEWADADGGACFGFRSARHFDGPAPSKAHIWATAFRDLRTYPPSWGGKRPAGACAWGMDPKDAPTDETVLDTDLNSAAVVYRKRMQAMARTYRNPFVAYAHVDDEWDAQRAGEGHPGSLRGTGVGRAMYLLAAQHLATTGRFLIASGTQTNHAEALWARLIADPTVPTRQTRRTYYRTGETHTYWCLDYRAAVSN